MIRRTVTFIAFVALVAAVSALVYLNPGETSFHYPPANVLTLPLGVLMLAATIAGMIAMFLLMLAREGRHAVRDWRVQRGIRSAERVAVVRAEARSLALAGDFARARSLFAKAMKTRNPDVGDLIDYADTYLQEGNAKEAKRLLENGQKDFGNAPLLLSALATAARHSGDYAGAISALERALSVYPRSLRLLALLRDVLVDTGAWPQARDIQQRIVQLRPSDEDEANRLVGTSYESALRQPPEERIAALKAITAGAPDFTPALVERARTVASAGDTRRALRILDKAIRRTPRGILFDETERLGGESDPARVAKLYLKSVETNPTLDGLRARAARLLLRIGRPQDAEEILDNSASADTRGVLAATRALLREAKGQLGDQATRGLSVADVRLNIPHWKCERCGSLFDRWTSRCTRCGSWGRVDDL